MSSKDYKKLYQKYYQKYINLVNKPKRGVVALQNGGNERERDAFIKAQLEYELKNKVRKDLNQVDGIKLEKRFSKYKKSIFEEIVFKLKKLSYPVSFNYHTYKDKKFVFFGDVHYSIENKCEACLKPECYTAIEIIMETINYYKYNSQKNIDLFIELKFQRLRDTGLEKSKEEMNGVTIRLDKIFSICDQKDKTECKKKFGNKFRINYANYRENNYYLNNNLEHQFDLGDKYSELGDYFDKINYLNNKYIELCNELDSESFIFIMNDYEYNLIFNNLLEGDPHEKIRILKENNKHNKNNKLLNIIRDFLYWKDLATDVMIDTIFNLDYYINNLYNGIFKENSKILKNMRKLPKYYQKKIKNIIIEDINRFTSKIKKNITDIKTIIKRIMDNKKSLDISDLCTNSSNNKISCNNLTYNDLIDKNPEHINLLQDIKNKSNIACRFINNNCISKVRNNYRFKDIADEYYKIMDTIFDLIILMNSRTMDYYIICKYLSLKQSDIMFLYAGARHTKNISNDLKKILGDEFKTVYNYDKSDYYEINRCLEMDNIEIKI